MHRGDVYRERIDYIVKDFEVKTDCISRQSRRFVSAVSPTHDFSTTLGSPFPYVTFKLFNAGKPIWWLRGLPVSDGSRSYS